MLDAIIEHVRRRVCVLLSLLFLAVGCGREKPLDTARETRPPVTDDTPQDGGTLYRRLEMEPTTLNPICAESRYDRWISHYLFTPLLHLDESLRPIPALAKSWEVSEDGLTFTFELEKNATFADGTPVRASDVLFTLKKIIDPASESLQVAPSFAHLDLTRTKVIDDHTIAVVFRRRLAMQLLRFNDVQVLSERFYSKGNFRNDYNNVAMGSGPYKLLRYVPQKEVVLERRSDYWSQRPHIQTVVFRVIDDLNTAWNAVKLGEIDETMISSDVWNRERNNPALTNYLEFTRFYTLNYNAVAWNTRVPLLREKRMRRALAMCVPIDAIVQDLYHGTARAMTGPFTPDDWAYNPTVPALRYDPEKARSELASMGWLDSDDDGILERDGKPLRITLMLMSGGATTQQFGQILQAEMKRVGIDLELTMLDSSQAVTRILAGNFEAAFLNWELDPDPDLFGMFHSTQVRPYGQNIAAFANAEVDRLIVQAREELDPSVRKEIYWRLHEMLMEEQPYTWTVQVSVKWAINKRVRGVATSRGYGLYLWYPGELGWWISKDAPQPGRGGQ
jgi:peptide/nickel transport system substrate-binding protein